MRRGIGGLLSIAVFLATAVFLVLTWQALDRRPRTNDGYLQADIVHLAPDVSGRIVDLPITDNMRVHRGDVLFRIDPEPFRYRVESARAHLRSLEAQLAVDTSSVSAQGSKADAANTSVRAAEATLAQATLTRRRLEPLGAQGYVTAQQVDQARTAERTAAADLEASRQQARSAREAVANTKPEEEQVAGARADLASAERDLRLTTVLAPCDGQVTALSISVGEYAATGRAVFTLIDTEHWWAIANFRETDLAGMRVGQAATVFMVGFGNQALSGTVESFGGGVSPDEGGDAGGLPHVPRTLSWVRIAQRFPVRVALHGLPPELQRIGATAIVSVDK